MPAKVKEEDRGDLLKGTLDLLILKALDLQPMHGWGISERLRQWSSDVLRINQGSLYPALYRLDAEGLVRSSWKTTDNNREARYYSITAAGVRELRREEAAWHRVSGAVNVVLGLRAV